MIAYNKTTMFLLVKTPPLRGDRLAMTVESDSIFQLTAKPFSPTFFQRINRITLFSGVKFIDENHGILRTAVVNSGHRPMSERRRNPIYQRR